MCLILVKISAPSPENMRVAQFIFDKSEHTFKMKSIKP